MDERNELRLYLVVFCRLGGIAMHVGSDALSVDTALVYKKQAVAIFLQRAFCLSTATLYNGQNIHNTVRLKIC